MSSDITTLFCGYLGNIKLNGLEKIDSENFYLRVHRHGVDVRVIDAVKAELVATRTHIHLDGVCMAPTMIISRTSNEFYGLIVSLAWTFYHKDTFQKQWWQAHFDRHVGDRKAFFVKAKKKFRGKFTNARMLHDKKSQVLRNALVNLMGVDCLHNASMYIEFLHNTFCEVNVNHLKILPMVVNVPKVDNVYFDESVIIVGNGGGDRLPMCTPDLIGHELAHGVTLGHVKLDYQNESGALDEHLSDISGFAYKQYMYKTYNNTIFGKADYLIGKNVFLKEDKYLRNISDPKSCNHPCMVGDCYWQDYGKDSSDYGGVHINCSIPSFLFFCVCEKKSVEFTIQLWYKCLKEMPSSCTFIQFGQILLRISENDLVVQEYCDLLNMNKTNLYTDMLVERECAWYGDIAESGCEY